MSSLRISNLSVSIEGKQIISNLNLTLQKGKVHVLMGPNGSGKSSLANTLMGHPKYQVQKGKVMFKGKNILELSATQRAKLGIFLAFQHPLEIPGVTLANFLRTAYNTTHKEKLSPIAFRKKVNDLCKKLKLPETFLERYLNEGFSGGEKKKAETLQMMLLSPEVIILDETDSGLDVDSLKVVSKGVKSLLTSDITVLIITHYQRILQYLTPDYVHVMSGGRVVKEGGKELVNQIEEHGYEEIGNEV